MPLKRIHDVTQKQCCTESGHTLVFLFNQPIFPELLQVRLHQVRPVPKSKLLGTVVAELLQAGHCSCRPTNSIKALKDCINITNT